jgi:hypothetical protein
MFILVRVSPAPSLPRILINADMLHDADAWAKRVAMRRTKASPIDALAGVLGEMIFAQYLFGNWRKHQLGANKGKSDFGTIEVKTSATPFSPRLHLLVREDYARKRKPLCTVQIVVDVARDARQIPINTFAMLCGYATSAEIDAAPLKDFGSKFGGDGGYRCHYIPISQLHPIGELRLV